MDVDKKEKPGRCEFTTCKKKLLLSDFACRCGNFYCLNHRLSEQHVCTYDYAGKHKNELLKIQDDVFANPLKYESMFTAVEPYDWGQRHLWEGAR